MANIKKFKNPIKITIQVEKSVKNYMLTQRGSITDYVNSAISDKMCCKKQTSQGWVNSLREIFEDYGTAKDAKDVDSAKSKFEDLILELEVV